MDWARTQAYITWTVDQKLLLRNEYLATENRILKAQLKTPLRFTDEERITLAEIAHRLGRKVLEDVANEGIVGAMANLGYTLSDQTVGKFLQCQSILTAPACKRTTSWTNFIRTHMAVLAGTDFSRWRY